MNQISKRKLLNRFLSLVISMYMITGCATRRVSFSSDPSGAIVEVGDEEHRTPCVLTIPDGQETVNIVHESGEVITLEVPEGKPFFVRTGSAIGKGGAYVLYGISLPFILIGAVGVGFAKAAAKGSPPSYYGDQDFGTVFFVATAGGLVVGMPLYMAAEYLDEISDLKIPVVHVVFPSALSTEQDSTQKIPISSEALEKSGDGGS